MKQRLVLGTIAVVFLTPLLAGCGPAVPTVTPVPATAVPVPPTSEAPPTTDEPDSNLYLGQIPPGLEVKVFAPGIVSTEEGKEYKITFSPNLEEILFTRRTPGRSDDRLWYSRLENGQLTVPELAPFGHDVLETDACFTPDGERVYFNSWRPLPGEDTPSPRHNVWFVDKTAGGWGEPQFLGPPLNDYRPVYFSIAQDGTLYFTRTSPREICYAELEDGQYGEINSLPDEINGLRDVAHPAVAPDESYLIVDSCYREGSVITGSLYISFRESDGSWTEAVSMRAALGASASDLYASPRITPDGEFLFFENYDQETDKADICWVSTQVVEGLRSQVLQAEATAEPIPTFAHSRRPAPSPSSTPSCPSNRARRPSLHTALSRSDWGTWMEMAIWTSFRPTLRSSVLRMRFGPT